MSRTKSDVPEKKRTVIVEIAGGRYRIASDADEQRLQQLVDEVNARIDQLGRHALVKASPAQVLVMVALGLTDDLLAAQASLDELKSETRDVVEAAVARIDQSLRMYDGADALE